jgi:hypothetical protein
MIQLVTVCMMVRTMSMILIILTCLVAFFFIILSNSRHTVNISIQVTDPICKSHSFHLHFVQRYSVAELYMYFVKNIPLQNRPK